MLKVRPKSAFSERYDVLDGRKKLTTVNIGWWREAGEFRLGGEGYKVGRQGLRLGLFYLEQDGKVLATAEKPSALFNRFRVHHRGTEYELARRSMLGRSFDLKRNGVRVGSMTATSAFTRSAEVKLPEKLPVPVQVFITWLVLVIWKRLRQTGTGA